MFIAIVIIVCCLFLAYVSFATVTPPQKAFRYTFGKLTKIYDQGICWAIPGIHRLEIIENIIQTINATEADGALDNVHYAITLQIQHLIKKNITPEQGSKYKQISKRPENSTEIPLISTVIGIIKSFYKTFIPKYSSKELPEKKDLIEIQILTLLQKQLDDFGIEVFSVKVTNSEPADPTVRDQATSIQKMQLEKERKKKELEIKKMTANMDRDIASIKADGEVAALTKVRTAQAELDALYIKKTTAAEAAGLQQKEVVRTTELNKRRIDLPTALSDMGETAGKILASALTRTNKEEPK